MIKILCLLDSAKFNVKNMAFMLFHDLKVINKKGWSQRNLTRVDPRVLLLAIL